MDIKLKKIGTFVVVYIAKQTATRFILPEVNLAKIYKNNARKYRWFNATELMEAIIWSLIHLYYKIKICQHHAKTIKTEIVR